MKVENISLSLAAEKSRRVIDETTVLTTMKKCLQPAGRRRAGGCGTVRFSPVFLRPS